MKQIILIILIILPLLLSSQEIIYQKWDEILTQYISSGYKDDIIYNSVNYDELEEDPKFKEILELLKNFDPAKLNNRNEELAFWVNVYNIAAVNMIIKYELPKSIKDIGNLFKPVWKYNAINVGGTLYTLNYIEHYILRSYKEPLIHFAIVCASLSCPDLINTVYLPDTIISQMEGNTRNFLKNSSKGIKQDIVNQTIYISKIFKWFEEDFDQGIDQFIKSYIDINFNEYDLKYLNYNWNLNSP